MRFNSPLHNAKCSGEICLHAAEWSGEIWLPTSSCSGESDFNSENSTNTKPNNQIWNQLRVWIIVQGGYFWWKKRSWKISCYCPFNNKIQSEFSKIFCYWFNNCIFIWRYMEFRIQEPIRNSVFWTVKNFAELRKIKQIPYKIPYSAEFQNDAFENILILTSEKSRPPEEHPTVCKLSYCTSREDTLTLNHL